jgi:DNA helicase-2/ATP-dependent DNA helicase PcrA
MLLMTFSRRALGEMTRRVERICAQVLGANAGIMTGALTWAGTFHGIGARLLRDYAEQLPLCPTNTEGRVVVRNYKIRQFTLYLALCPAP